MGVQVNYISEVKMGHRTTKTNHKVKVHKTVSCRLDFFYYAFRNVLLVSVPLLVVCAFILGFSTSHSSAEANNKSTVSSSSSDNISFTLSTSCTISGEVISAHTASLNGGQLVEDVGNTKMNAYCNDNNGYSIYAIGSSGDIDGNTDLISSISDSYNVKTGVYDSSTASSLTPSSWAMKLTAGIGTGSNPTVPTIENGYDSYKEVPDIYTLVAKRTSKTDMSLDTTLSGSYINTTYKIYASSIQPAGTYSGKVKYVMVHPNSNNNHLGFNEIYALHNKTPITTENGTYYTMQDMDATICNQVDVYDEVSQTQLIDKRDGKTYWVTKLKDGHCWMTENLDIDINSSISFNSNNTDLNVAYDSSTRQYTEYSDGYTESNGVIYWEPASSATTIDFQNTGPIIGWQNSNTAPYTASKIDSTETGHASLGNYYNWTAAIASNNSSSLTQNTLSDISKNPKNSICPKGWRLPTISNQSNTISGSTNEFARLNHLYSENSPNSYAKLVISPLWFLQSGYTYDTSFSGIGDYGVYWSSTINSAANAGFLEFSSRGAKPTESYVRSAGRSVRCVAR